LSPPVFAPIVKAECRYGRVESRRGLVFTIAVLASFATALRYSFAMGKETD
jgi:hypothetical protein